MLIDQEDQLRCTQHKKYTGRQLTSRAASCKDCLVTYLHAELRRTQLRIKWLEQSENRRKMEYY